MANLMDRRQFVKYCTASAIAAASLLPVAAEAANSARYRIASGFDTGQEGIIKHALSRAVFRLQEERIWKKTYEAAKWSFVTNDAMKKSNLSDSHKNRWNLLWHQLYWLSQPNGPNDNDPAFPNIVIHPQYLEGGSWVGQAPLNRVTIYKDSDVQEFRQQGTFNVELNSAYVGRGDVNPVYMSVDYWAGTIAHEMLHNLGHLHGDERTDANYDSYQINVLDRVLASNGYDSKGAHGAYASSAFGSRSLSHPGCGVRSR